MSERKRLIPQTSTIEQKKPSPKFLSVTVIVPLLLVLSIIAAVLLSMGETSSTNPTYLKYTTEPGYFYQDDAETDWKSFDYTKNFGLKLQNWQTFSGKVKILNREADRNTKYKVLFLGRHGEGYHNVAEAYYGTEAWDCYYSMLEGNTTTRWADAQLTPRGIAQAELASRTWLAALKAGLPPPEAYYSSPLTRCLQTAFHTFGELSESLDSKSPFAPQIKELLRETIGVHTCDRRSTKSEIYEFWKAYDSKGKMPFSFESDFTMNDEIWDKEMRELPVGEDRRSLHALDEIFQRDEAVWISISGHSGIIGSLLRVLEHRDFGLTTGAVIPVLVRCKVVSGVRAPLKGEGYERIVGCKEPPGRGNEGAIGEPIPHAATSSGPL